MLLIPTSNSLCLYYSFGTSSDSTIIRMTNSSQFARKISWFLTTKALHPGDPSVPKKSGFLVALAIVKLRNRKSVDWCWHLSPTPSQEGCQQGVSISLGCVCLKAKRFSKEGVSWVVTDGKGMEQSLRLIFSNILIRKLSTGEYSGYYP